VTDETTRGIAIIAAPSNLGLRPPQPTSVPGCAKAPEALREAGLYQRLISAGALDAGTVLAPRYVDDSEPGRLRNQDGILDYSRRLSDRITKFVSHGRTPLVIGGDCSILVGAGLAMACHGRYGLVHLDGHTDFRHPGNSPSCASLAGEDLAAVVGRHWPTVSDIDGLAPYFHPLDTAHIGCRDNDEHLTETRAHLGKVVPVSEIKSRGVQTTIDATLDIVASADLDGFWLHLDVDILDPHHLPAVDSPDPGGIDPSQLRQLLAGLAPHALGAEVTIFDPDLDPGGHHAAMLTTVLAEGFSALGAGTRLP
jgi:arginase